MAITYVDSVTCTLTGDSTDTYAAGRIVYFNGGTVEYTPTSGSLPAGILDASGVGGEPALIACQGGTILCDASGSVSAGWVGSSGDGDGKVRNVSANYAVGRAVEASVGGKIRVLVDINKLS